jgi:glycogen operon protein
VTLNDLLQQASIAWHGVRLGQPDWSRPSHTLAMGASVARAGLRLHLILNAYWEPLDFDLPPAGDEGTWRRWIDTALDPPNDIVPWLDSPPFSGRTYRAAPRSVVALWSPTREGT